jgi:hypothetical protein
MRSRLTTLIACITLAVPAVSQDKGTQRLPTAGEIDGIVYGCAGGRSYGFTSSVSAGFKEWRKGVVNGSLRASAESVGAILSRVPVDAAESKIYETYTKCFKDAIAQFLTSQSPAAQQQLKYARLEGVSLAPVLGRRDLHFSQFRQACNGTDCRFVENGQCVLKSEYLEWDFWAPDDKDMKRAVNQCLATPAYWALRESIGHEFT